MRYSILGLFLLLSLTFVCQTVNAQPGHEHLKGCHYSWNAKKMKPLTQKQQVNQILSAQRSDTIDILNYNITLEIIDFTNKRINGNTEVTFTPKMDNTNRIELNLLGFNVDSVYFNTQKVGFNNDGLFVTIPFPTVQNTGDVASVKIWYNGQPTVSPGGFGGLDFRDGIAYNLGIGLGSDPYNYGRGWYPCFDNFVERATYDFNIISKLPRKAYCSGNLMAEVDMGGDTIMRSYNMQLELPSYLAGVAVGNFAEYNAMHDGLERDIPIQLVAAPQNIDNMVNSFVDLGGVIDALEYWFGPYAWNRVGYVTTNVGAMEHSDNIAYPTFSAIGGNTFGNRRLMAHELAHHWWGNVAGIPGASDMWFKEGNAEYSAHLITEYLFGTEAFVDQVKDNHLDVISTAHLDDGDYLPLSGIPFENTYGTHTYNKGASMMHNLRGYLGDENFRTGMTSVQENLGFQSITADDFRDHLTAVTGVPLVDFFQDWLKSPGWSGFNIEKLASTPNGNGYEVTVDLLQGKHNTPEFHKNVPLSIVFHGPNDQVDSVFATVNNEFSQHTFQVPFQPNFAVLNEPHYLNLGNTLAIDARDEPGVYSVGVAGIGMSTTEQSGPMKLWLDQKWFGPTPITGNPEVRLAKNRFWDLRGEFPASHDLKGTIQYRGNSESAFEFDLTNETEDSLILAFRFDADEDWVEYPDYFKNVLGSPNDGVGIVTIYDMRPGHYCLANGTLALSGLNEQEPTLDASLFPNPAFDLLQLNVEALESGTYTLKIYGVLGQTMTSNTLSHQGGSINEKINLGILEAGSYWISLENNKGKVLLNKQFNKL